MERPSSVYWGLAHLITTEAQVKQGTHIPEVTAFQTYTPKVNRKQERMQARANHERKTVKKRAEKPVPVSASRPLDLHQLSVLAKARLAVMKGSKP